MKKCYYVDTTITKKEDNTIGILTDARFLEELGIIERIETIFNRYESYTNEFMDALAQLRDVLEATDILSEEEFYDIQGNVNHSMFLANLLYRKAYRLLLEVAKEYDFEILTY